MIRLIAADMDGTLLNSKGELPKHLFEAIRILKKRGVLFAAASGRQYYNLETLFSPVRDEMMFLCENGSMIFFSGRTCIREWNETKGFGCNHPCNTFASPCKDCPLRGTWSLYGLSG